MPHGCFKSHKVPRIYTQRWWSHDSIAPNTNSAPTCHWANERLAVCSQKASLGKLIVVRKNKFQNIVEKKNRATFWHQHFGGGGGGPEKMCPYCPTKTLHRGMNLCIGVVASKCKVLFILPVIYNALRCFNARYK